MLDRGGGSGDRDLDDAPPSFVPASREEDVIDEVSLISKFVTPLPLDLEEEDEQETEDEAGATRGQIGSVRDLE